MNIRQRHFIKGTEIKELKDDISKYYDATFVDQIFPKKASVEIIINEDGDTLIAVNNKLTLWKSKDGYLPVLTLLLDPSIKVPLKSILVDSGAIKYVANGADVMRPGIRKIDPTIKKDDIVRVADETHDRTLAVGKAMYNAQEMQKLTEGKTVKNLHTIVDKTFAFAKSFH